MEFAGDHFYLRSLWNSLVLGLATVACTSVLGFAIAFLLVRYDFLGRNLFSYLTLIPIISPPLVGVLGFTFILGRAGTVNVLLMDYLGLNTPINFVYGIHGVLLVETLHLFPMIALNVVDALGKIDPALEEAAESVGARGWRKLRTITLPLTTPGYIAGALLVFIWTFSDFATPLVLGVHDLLASQAYLNIVQFVDRRLFRMGIVISALMVLLAVVFLLAARHYVAIKDYSSLSYSRIARRRLGPLGQAAAVGFLSAVMLLSFIPYLGVALASVGQGWSLTPFPVQYTLHYFERVIVETPKYIVNSFLSSGLAVAICILIGVPIAWLLARTRAPGRDTLDALNTLILAIPGTAIGIAYVRAFHVEVPGWDRALTSLWIIIPIVLAVRRLPYTVRGTYASLLLVHRSMEEAAASVGAPGLSVVPRHHAAAHLARRARRLAVLVHDVAPGGLGGAVPLARRLGDDHGGDLLLLHRGQRQRGRRAGCDPDRGRQPQRAGDQPGRGHPHGRDVRLRRGRGCSAGAVLGGKLRRLFLLGSRR